MLDYNGTRVIAPASASDRMKFRTIVNNPALQKFGRRFLFSLLSIWVHFAALFYVTMILFSHGEHGEGDVPASLRHLQKIDVSLEQPVPPQDTTPKPASQAPKAANKPNENIPPVEPEAKKENPPPEPRIVKPGEKEAPPPPKAPETPPQPNDANESASTEGVLNCNTLTSKPRMIVSGEGFMRIKDIDNPAGSVTLRVKIHRDGTVIDVVVEESTMTKKMEGQAVVAAYHSLFSPGKMGDVAVDCTTRYKVSN